MTEDHTLIIRAEDPDDRKTVASLLREAFGGDKEVQLMEKLYSGEELSLSLVAESGGEIAGHIAFTRAPVAGPDGKSEVAWLAPLAVRPDSQRQGIGSSLVFAGLESCLMLGFSHAVVLGYPDFYSRLGFSAEAASKVTSRWPKEALMVAPLSEDVPALEGELGDPAAFAVFD